MSRLLTASLLLLVGLIGLVALVIPILAPDLAGSNILALNPEGQPGNAGYAISTMMLIGFSVVILLLEIQEQTSNAKIIAALGVLIAITSVLRFVETAIPGFGGFSPVFVPIILAGYVFGARFGFLMGTLSMLTSALLTAGVGPWLPYQMFVAGWIGATAGLLPHPENSRLELALLVFFAFAWGLLYGGIINLYFWPFISTANQLGGSLDDAVTEVAARYGAFYLSTSFAWDLARSLGNIALVMILGLPAVRALSRFRDRFRFEAA